MSARASAARRPLSPRGEAATAPRPAPRAVPRPRPRRARLRVARLLVPVVAVLLGGIVWVNVARLMLTTQTSTVIEQARAVEAESAQMEAQLERINGQVEHLARRSGMVRANGVTHLQLVPPEGAPGSQAGGR